MTTLIEQNNIWKFIKDNTPKNKTNTPLQDEDDGLVYDDTDKANMMASYWERVFWGNENVNTKESEINDTVEKFISENTNTQTTIASSYALYK